MPRLRAAFYGDDFTGSVDALLQFARRGWTGRLFVGLPTAEALERAAAEVDVVGIAGIARSLPTADLEGEVRPVLEALVALDPQFVQYKACSTADSSPSIGSIGRVLEIGREVVGRADRPARLRPARLRPLHAARRTTSPRRAASSTASTGSRPCRRTPRPR